MGQQKKAMKVAQGCFRLKIRNLEFTVKNGVSDSVYMGDCKGSSSGTVTSLEGSEL